MASSWDNWLQETFGIENEPVYEIETPADRKRAAFQNINERMEYLEDIANQALENANGFVTDLKKNIADLVLPETESLDVQIDDVPSLNYADRPGLEPIGELDTELPTLDKTLSLLPVDDSDLSGIEFPVFSIPDPAINEPEKPSLDAIGQVPDAPPLRDIEIPTMDDIVLPTTPVLTETRIPEMQDVTIPEFDATMLPF